MMLPGVIETGFHQDAMETIENWSKQRINHLTMLAQKQIWKTSIGNCLLIYCIATPECNNP